jgi:hypothetical protein
MIDKKPYSPPELIVYGDVEKITQKGGGGHADAPIGPGDPIGPNNTSFM